MRKTVTLFIPPYLFRRKKKALNIGKKPPLNVFLVPKMMSRPMPMQLNMKTQFGTPEQWMEQALVPNSYLDFIFLEVASNVLNRRIRVLHVVGGHFLDFTPRTTTGNLFIF